jgi:F0F1-type ATP synthase delta subunit
MNPPNPNNNQASRLMELLDEVYSVADLNNLIRLLNNIKPMGYDGTTSLGQKIQSELPPKLAKFITDYVSFSNYNLDDQNDAQRILQEVIYLLHHIPVAEITTPQPMTYKQIERMCKWWRTSTNKPIILNLKTNPEILAGMTIGFEGHYTDYSLGTWLQDKGKEYLDKIQVDAAQQT